MNTLGQELRRLRQATGVSLRSTASAASISPAYLSDIERDKRSCSSSVLGRLAAQLGVKPADLERFDSRAWRRALIERADLDKQLEAALRALAFGQVSPRQVVRLANEKRGL